MINVHSSYYYYLSKVRSLHLLALYLEFKVRSQVRYRLTATDHNLHKYLKKLAVGLKDQSHEN